MPCKAKACQLSVNKSLCFFPLLNWPATSPLHDLQLRLLFVQFHLDHLVDWDATVRASQARRLEDFFSCTAPQLQVYVGSLGATHSTADFAIHSRAVFSLVLLPGPLISVILGYCLYSLYLSSLILCLLNSVSQPVVGITVFNPHNDKENSGWQCCSTFHKGQVAWLAVLTRTAKSRPGHAETLCCDSRTWFPKCRLLTSTGVISTWHFCKPHHPLLQPKLV